MTVLYERIIQQVQRKPEALALVGGGRLFTYHALNAQVNRLANYLRQLDVGQGDIVAIHCGRTPDAIIAILAVQKTGAAYLPLDPLYPRGRLNHMLADSGAKMLLTVGELAKDLDDTSAKRLHMDELSATLLQQSDDEPPLPTDPRRPFYVIYTSGSTGQPKGTVVRYDAFENLVEWYVNTLSMTADDALLLVTSLAFDLTQKNIIAPLVTGGTLYLAAEEGFDPAEILSAIPATGTTIINCTPTHIYTLVEQATEAQLDNLDHLRRLTLGGEALDISRLRRWWNRDTFKTTFMNSYGPTECTGIVSYYPVQNPRDFDGRPVPISIPIPNASLHVVDESGQPVKPGTEGELYITGLCVGLGYLHKPELTAERFVSCNLPNAKGNVAYRTGDLCLLDTDGAILFQGRIDQQVKIRGLRIELGEIEAALRDFPGIRDAAVTPVSVKRDDVRIVGYLIPSDPAAPIVLSDLRAKLRDNLPDYMIPAQFVYVDAFPMTASGKLDRRNLPVPDWTQLDAEREIVALETETEKSLARLFSDVLEVDRIGATDDFFGLGGHSLSALRLLTRIHEQFDIKLGLRTLFDTSTVRGMATAIDTTPKRKRSAVESAIVPTSRNTWLPLSFAQQRLWFLEQYQPGLTAYNCASAYHITGHLEINVLEMTLNEIVRRHEILRTTFSSHDSAPAQHILPHIPFAVEVHDLTTITESAREAEAVSVITEDAQQPYDITTGPLFRFRVLKLTDEKHVLAVQFHHIVFDGWSANVFLDELSTIYKAFCAGKPSPLPELTLQYADFAAWQSTIFQGETLATSLDYWRRHLGDNPPNLDLPTDRVRPSAQTYCGDTITLKLPPSLSEALRALSRKEGVTLFTTLLAAWRTFLHRYTGQTDIIIGSAVAGRTRAALEGMIGFFVNMLAIRVDLSENPRFVELLGLEHETTLSAYDNQEIPFDSVVAGLLPSRDPSRSPLFQVAFAGQNTRTAPVQFAGLSVTAEELSIKTAKFDLTLYAVDAEDEILLPLEYNTDLFDASTIQRWIRNFQCLLEGIVKDPQKRIDTIQLLCDDEQQQILAERVNGKIISYPYETNILELFEAEVSAHPDALAVSSETTTWTYQELNAKANALAHRLRSSGIGPERIVAVLLERSTDYVTAVLGILKAGGAYLPMDAAYPRASLTFMLEDSGASLVLTQTTLAELLPDNSGVDILCLDTFFDKQSALPTTAPESDLKSDHLAYVIYTSGSTGTPKGVAVTHRTLMNLVQWHNFQFGQSPFGKMTSTDRATLLAGVAFDASVWELWPYLAVGASIHIPSLETRASFEALRDWLVAKKITVCFLPTPLAEALLEFEWPAETALRYLLTGGDILHIYPQQGLPFSLVNNYGPTENTVVTTSGIVSSSPNTQKLPTIGTPIANNQVYLLDRNLCLAPIGAPGEICVAGKSLARGYLNRPELTAERFVPNPFVPGDRLYRTGDNGRYAPDGQIEFLGRTDDQVKLRGYRIELGEIEATLLSHPGVKEVTVIVRTSSTGDKRLAAFVAVRPAETPDTETLRQYLSDRLPAHMIPAEIVLMEELPLTPNGKYDRRALEKIQPVSITSSETYVPPRDELETELSKVWMQLLDLKTIGIHDNFFILGGHSLLATRLVVCIRTACNVDISLRDLFECPTIELLAKRIKNTSPEHQPVSLSIHIVPIPRNAWLPLSFAQQRLLFLEQYHPALTAYNCASAFHISGHLEMAVLEKALNEIVRRHEILRTVFSTNDSTPAQHILPHTPFIVDVRDLTTLPESSRETKALHVIAEDAQRPYNLTTGPLFRFMALKLADDKQVLAVQFHHIVFDGWSARVLLDELATLYEAFHAEKPSPLPELAVQYADFAAWQSKVFQGETLTTALEYWQKHLGDNPPTLDLPTDRTRPPVQSYCGDTVNVTLPPSLNKALRALSSKERVTLFTTLLAAWRSFLHRYTGQTDIIIGSAVAGRTRESLESMFGFFVNMLAIRVDLSGNPNFVELLRQEHESTLAAYENQEIPFESVVAGLLPSRDPSRSPLFQVAFAGQNRRNAPIQFAGLSVKAEELSNKTAKFDLTLIAVDAEDEISLSLEYNTDLFDQSTIQRWIQSFQFLLEGIVTDPRQKIASLPLLCDEERHQLLVEWNKDTIVPYPREASIPELFEAEVAAHPDTVAIVTDTTTWTYQELNAKANILAHRLHALGVKPGMFVGLCMERSAEMIAATLGILKAGAAYVPLDPAYPSARLQYMLNDANPTGILVSQESIPRVAETFKLYPHPILDVGTVLEEAGNETNLERTFSADHLAYVMYTSGSTGTPKGVCVEHRSVVRLVKGLNYATLDTSETLFHFAPISFDASTFEIWGALLNGARLVVYPAELPSLKDLGDAIIRHGVTTLWLTAGLFHQMVEANLDSLRGVRQLLSGGDILSVSHVRRVLEQIPQTTLINGYGPTECTTFTCCYPMRGTLEPCTSVPIGRPISNTPIYILDTLLQPVPIGVPGELYVGGDGVAREYLNAPELTSERFIPNPFAPGRLYKTGDQVRYLPDGRVLFLGRADGQIKLRGFRIEPGEIETTLLSHPDVREAAVILRANRAGDKRLAVFVTVDQAKTPDTETLRTYLSERLPAHMVPADIIPLAKLPLTPNGKLDRRSLEKILPVSLAVSDTYVPPRDELEKKLSRVWAQLLDLKAVGIHDNFFQLGGHSLLAIRLVICFRTICGFEISLRDIFECPTIELLANRVKSALPSTNIAPPEGDRYLEQLRKGSTNPPFICVTGAGSVTGYYAALAEHMSLEQPFYGLKDPSLDEEHDTFPTVETLAARYIQSLQTIQPHGPYYLGGWSFGGIVAFEMAQQLTHNGEEVALLALIDTSLPRQGKRSPQSSAERIRSKAKRFRYEVQMLCGSWKILLRYLWDASGILFQSLTGQKKPMENQVSVRGYMAWAWHDIHTQYTRKKAKLEKPSLRDPRLRMIEDPFVRLVFKTMKARRMAMMSHTHKPYPGEVTLICASDTAEGKKQTLGWDEIAQGGVVIHKLTGGHESILKEPYVSETSKVLQDAIDKAHKARNH